MGGASGIDATWGGSGGFWGSCDETDGVCRTALGGLSGADSERDGVSRATSCGVLGDAVAEMVVAWARSTPRLVGNRGLSIPVTKLTEAPPTTPPTTSNVNTSATRFIWKRPILCLSIERRPWNRVPSSLSFVRTHQRAAIRAALTCEAQRLQRMHAA